MNPFSLFEKGQGRHKPIRFPARPCALENLIGMEKEKRENKPIRFPAWPCARENLIGLEKKETPHPDPKKINGTKY